MDDKRKFEYTYAAPTESERKMAQDIRDRYEAASPAAPKDKLAQLQELDQKAKRAPKLFLLIFGIGSVLLFGTGLSLVLELDRFTLGVALSGFGIACVAITYPLYRCIAKRQRDKYKAEIVRLSDEILHGGK